jgi:hypothetical protein
MTDTRTVVRIGVDFDGTLVGGRRSAALRRFIDRHAGRGVEFVIVTHRSHGLEHDIFPMLSMPPGPPLNKSHFKEVINVPDDLFEGSEGARMAEFYMWKGKVCQEVDAILLIDDKPEVCLAGCEANGISFLHIDDFPDDRTTDVETLLRVASLHGMRKP